MRGEYDIVEDTRVKKNQIIITNKFTKIILGLLFFLILCGLCFNLVYLLSFNNIVKNSDTKNANDKDSTKKIFIIEQKLRKDLEKMYPNISSK